MDTKARVRFISLILFISVFALWAIFYVIILGYITESANQQITLAGDQIIERLGGEFSDSERFFYSLTHSAEVQALLHERELRAFFELGGAAAKSFESGLSSDFINSVILYDAEGNNYQLTGSVGNKACSRLFSVVSSLRLPHHLSVALDGKRYVGYADIIPLPNGNGTAAILIEEERILEVLRTYDQSGSLLAAIRAGDETVATNTDREVENFPGTVMRSGLGVTPYEIIVAADEGYMDASLVSFSVVAVITAALFAVMLFSYTGILNRRFFRPMTGVIGGVKRLQADAKSESLPHVGSAEFDDLIDKINEMLAQIEVKNAEVLAAEVGRQKALVVSLQKQINAHFTVNTMGAIRTAVAQGEMAKAESLISGLMRIVRYAHSKEEEINIWDEEEILRYYTNIMSSRYGGKLMAEFIFDEDLMDVKMPRMLLQPLIENAVEHGFVNMDAGCFISVRAELRGSIIRFTVSDNGHGMDETALAALQARLGAVPGDLEGLDNIALLNIRNRLYYYYGNAAGIKIARSADGGVEVMIEIPKPPEKGGAA